MRTNLIVILSTIVALAANVALDMYTDLPMLNRWTIAVGLGLLTTSALSKLFKQRQKRNNNEELDRS